MFRRRSTSEAPAATASGPGPATKRSATSAKGRTPKKGVRTPKRSESEANLRRPLNAPRSMREAMRRNKEERRRQAKLQRQAYANNDERYFRPQDRGKVRAYARDFVDSRRMISEFFLIFSLVILGLLLVPMPEVNLVVTYLVWPTMMITIVLEGFWTSRQVKRRAAELYPEESVKGAGWYAAMRMLQIRRLRLPKPRVRPGDSPEPAGR